MRVNMSSNKVEPTSKDVLLGRAANVFHHPGNHRYRRLINLNLKRYMSCKTRLDKMILIRSLTETVLDDGKVRFLRCSKEGEWEETPFKIAIDKVSHALRDGINKPIYGPADITFNHEDYELKPAVNVSVEPPLSEQLIFQRQSLSTENYSEKAYKDDLL